jgi:hypothetical protein
MVNYMARWRLSTNALGSFRRRSEGGGIGAGGLCRRDTIRATFRNGRTKNVPRNIDYLEKGVTPSLRPFFGSGIYHHGFVSCGLSMFLRRFSPHSNCRFSLSSGLVEGSCDPSPWAHQFGKHYLALRPKATTPRTPKRPPVTSPSSRYH